MRAGSTGGGWIAIGTFWLACLGACAAGRTLAAEADATAQADATTGTDATAAVKAAAAAYAAAFNKADYAALADQWTERATLVEGSLALEGRGEILKSLRAWRERHPEATMEIAVGDVDLLAEPLARVAGTLKFVPKPGAKPVMSRFTSLRVREGQTWRLAESVVVLPEVAARAVVCKAAPAAAGWDQAVHDPTTWEEWARIRLVDRVVGLVVAVLVAAAARAQGFLRRK